MKKPAAFALFVGVVIVSMKWGGLLKDLWGDDETERTIQALRDSMIRRVDERKEKKAEAKDAAEEAWKVRAELAFLEARIDQRAAEELEKGNALFKKDELLRAVEKLRNTWVFKLEERMKRIGDELAKEARLELGIPGAESNRPDEIK